MSPSESEWRTRRQRIDPKLDAAGWRLPRDGKRSMKPSRSVEEPTSNGPADYALWLNQHIVGVVEAKKLTLVNEIYRLMKSGVAKRVLFLVDRRALAAQAVRTFSSFDAEPGQKFNQVYEVYSSKFQREDFGEEEKFDPKLLPQSYLTD